MAEELAVVWIFDLWERFAYPVCTLRCPLETIHDCNQLDVAEFNSLLDNLREAFHVVGTVAEHADESGEQDETARRLPKVIQLAPLRNTANIFKQTMYQYA